MVDLKLYIKEGEQFRVLEVPEYIVKKILRDRLAEYEFNRINRFAEKTKKPDIFKPGSVVVDFSNKTAQCFQTRINMEDLQPIWNVQVEKMTLNNY